MKKLNIVFCIDTMGKGGAERVVSVLSNELIKNNNVSIITTTYSDNKYELDKKINLYNVGSENYKNSIIQFIGLIPSFFIRIRRLRKLFNKIKPDIIISFLPAASFFSVAANKCKYKLIISDRNDPKIEYSNKLYNFLMKKYYPKADGYVFQTNDAKNYFNNILDFNNKKFNIIYNPVDIKFFNNKKEYSDEKIIVSIGRLFDQKNHILLLNAFKKINQEYPNYKLVIYGEGPMRSTLENMIEKENIKNVILPGMTNNVSEKLLESSFYVLSSDYEGMPNSLLEAMCLGLPVISTDCPCGAPKEIIDNNKNGILVEINNIEQLYIAMKKYIEDINFRNKCGINALKIRDKVNPENIVNEWYNFIIDVIEKEK